MPDGAWRRLIGKEWLAGKDLTLRHGRTEKEQAAAADDTDGADSGWNRRKRRKRRGSSDNEQKAAMEAKEQ